MKLLFQRNYGLLWFGGLVSSIGDWVLTVALPFYVYERTHSALASSAIWIALFAPGALFGSVAGVFVDRWDRRRTMLTVDVARTLLILALLLVPLRNTIWIVYPVLLVTSTIAQFFGPAHGALIPRLVGEEQLLEANALGSLGDNFARIVGPSLGGVLMAVAGLPGVVLVDSATFLFSAVMIYFLSVRFERPTAASATPSAGSSWIRVWREWREGLELIAGERLITSVFLVATTSYFADSIVSVLLAPFVKNVVHAGPALFGWMWTARGIGGIAGGVVIGFISGRVDAPRILSFSLMTAGVIVLVFINAPLVPVVVGMMVIVGIPVVGWLTSEATLLQSRTTDRHRGRILGAFGTTTALTGLAGSLIGGALGDRLGLVPVLDATAMLYTVAGLAAWMLVPVTRASVPRTRPGT